ncbi:hypothetical protein AGIG_G1071 [Arapaima gigas]
MELSTASGEFPEPGKQGLDFAQDCRPHWTGSPASALTRELQLALERVITFWYADQIGLFNHIQENSK